MGMPCIPEKEEFECKDTSTDKLKTAINLQSLRKACRMRIPKHIQQWQESDALFERS